MLVLFGILTLLIRRKPAPGTLMGVFCLYYGVARGLSDFLRVNDKTVLGLTGAQWMCVAAHPDRHLDPHPRPQRPTPPSLAGRRSRRRTSADPSREADGSTRVRWISQAAPGSGTTRTRAAAAL